MHSVWVRSASQDFAKCVFLMGLMTRASSRGRDQHHSSSITCLSLHA